MYSLFDGQHYDWFVKGDDDSFLVIENLRFLLSHYKPDDPVYLGHLFKRYLKQVCMCVHACQCVCVCICVCACATFCLYVLMCDCLYLFVDLRFMCLCLCVSAYIFNIRMFVYISVHKSRYEFMYKRINTHVFVHL